MEFSGGLFNKVLLYLLLKNGNKIGKPVRRSVLDYEVKHENKFFLLKKMARREILVY